MKATKVRMLACTLAVIILLNGAVPVAAQEPDSDGVSISDTPPIENVATPGSLNVPDDVEDLVIDVEDSDIPADEIITKAESGEPNYEIIPAPDLEYGTITTLNAGSSQKGRISAVAAQPTRKILTLNVNDTVMIPMADGRTLKFRVMAKDHYKFGAGVVLMSTQYVAMVTYKCGDTARGAGKYTLAGGGSFYDSILRNYLNSTFYNELHPNLKTDMKKAAQGEQYLMATYQSGVMWRYEYHWYNDYVFMPSTYEVSQNINSSHNYYGQSWGANTNWKNCLSI